MISVLAFDLAKNRTGWAVGKPDIMDKGKAGWGVFEPEPGDNMEHVTLGNFARLLQDLHKRHEITHIVWEKLFVDLNPQKFQFNGTRGQIHLEGVLLAYCGLHDINPSDVAISTWRKATYGTAKAQPNEGGKLEDGYWKKLALSWAASHGYTVAYHDEAEALAILWWALGQLDTRFAGWSDPIFRRNDLHAMFRRGIHVET